MLEPCKKTPCCTKPCPNGQKHRGACMVNGKMRKPDKMQTDKMKTDDRKTCSALDLARVASRRAGPRD